MTWSRSIAALVAGVALTMGTASAEAKTKHESRYTFQQTFGSAVRLLKVDLGYEVVERDPDMGYVLFLYTSPESGDRASRGSISFVETTQRVQVNLQIPEMPSYHEQVLMDKLRHKLQDEHGDPPAPARTPEGDDGDKRKTKPTKPRKPNEPRKGKGKSDDDGNGNGEDESPRPGDDPPR